MGIAGVTAGSKRELRVRSSNMGGREAQHTPILNPQNWLEAALTVHRPDALLFASKGLHLDSFFGGFRDFWSSD